MLPVLEILMNVMAQCQMGPIIILQQRHIRSSHGVFWERSAMTF